MYNLTVVLKQDFWWNKELKIQSMSILPQTVETMGLWVTI